MSNTEIQGLNPEGVLSSALEKTKEYYPQWVKSSVAATAAMSKVTKIETDEEDEKANKLLVAVKATYDKIHKQRIEITQPLEDLKEQLMAPEKTVSALASHKDSDVNRIKALRNNFATKKAQAAEAERKKIQAEQNLKEERARLKVVFEEKFFTGVLTQVGTMENNIEAFFNALDLETYDEKIKKFDIKAKLSQKYYEELFIVEFDANKITVAQFNDFLSEVKAQFTYEAINAIYVEKAQPIIDAWKAKLPAKKVELEELAALAAKDAKAAEAKKEELATQAAVQKQQRETEQQNELNAKREELEHKKNLNVQEAQFEAQIAQQSVGANKNTRATKIATITAEDVNIVKVLSQVLFVNFSNPNFDGHIKKDKNTGLNLIDDKGRPVYQPWVETLLDFYANNCDVAIEGIKVDTSYTAITKK